MPSLRPFVLIGVGGSGGKTVRVVREALRQKLIEVDWAEPWPDAWQLLHIDVPTAMDGITEALPYQLSAEQYFPLASRYANYDSVRATVAAPGDDRERRYLGIDCWDPQRPEDVDRLIDISLGAGQYRAVGRMVLLSRMADVAKRIDVAIDTARAATPDVLLSLGERLLGEEPDTPSTSQPFVVVTGSLAGGSGSGTLLDVCDIVRVSSNTSGVREIIAMIYTPELFQDESGGYDPGVAPNTFVALNEVFNAMTHAGGEAAPAGREFLYARAGVRSNKRASGPSAAVLIGRKNRAISLGGAAEIYQVMGRAIANLLSDPDVQGNMVSYVLGNAAARVSGELNLNPLASEDSVHTGDFKAMGFARLSVGREYFARYGGERIARAGVERLLEFHLRLARGGDRPAEDLINDLVTQVWPSFLRDSKCAEYGAGPDGKPNNDIVEALWPAGAEGFLDAWASDATSRTLQFMHGEPTAPGRVREEISTQVRNHLVPIGTTRTHSFLEAMYEAGRRWVVAMHPVLANLAVDTLVRYGLPAATALFDRLADHLERARAALISDSNAAKRKADSLLTSFPTVAAADPRRVEPRPDALRKFMQEGTGIIRGHWRAEEYAFAAKAAEDIKNGLVVPWTEALSDIEGLLRQQARPTHGHSVVEYWPGSRGVPEHLRPSRAEYLLVDVEEFPKEFVRLIRASVPGNLLEDEAVEAAVMDVVRGLSDPAHPDIPSLTRYTQRWVPKTPQLRDASHGGGLEIPATVAFELTIDLLFRRAMAWLKDSRKPSGMHLRASMSQYLTESNVAPAEHVARANRLKGQLAAALAASAPLAAIDAQMLAQLHGEMDAPATVSISALNVPDDQQLKADLRGIAAAAGLPQGSLRFTTTPRPDALMVQVTERGYHPMVYASVMGPLSDQWARASMDSKLRTDFWRWRRTRPLTESVPLDRDTRENILRGWYVSRLLGSAKVMQSRDRGYRIAVRGAEGWLKLPEFGPRPVSPENAPGNVLELVAVAIVAAYGDRSLAPLEPWRELIERGHHDASPLRRWIHDGGALPVDGEPIIDSDPGSPRLRAQLVLDLLEEMASLAAADASLAGKPRNPQSRVVAEVVHEIEMALASLQDDIAPMAQSGVDGGPRRR